MQLASHIMKDGSTLLQYIQNPVLTLCAVSRGGANWADDLREGSRLRKDEGIPGEENIGRKGSSRDPAQDATTVFSRGKDPNRNRGTQLGEQSAYSPVLDKAHFVELNLNRSKSPDGWGNFQVE
jgi:hypothetical protein